jgi:hypothetical protein
MVRADEGEEDRYNDMPPLVEDTENTTLGSKSGFRVFKSKL